MSKIIEYLLSFPRMYRHVTLLLRGKKTTQQFVDTYIKPKAGERVLDIGCGPGDLLRFLPPVDYCGFDMDPSYIEAAKRRYGLQGKFFCKKVSREVIKGNDLFDLIIAMGVVHHLDDREVQEMSDLALHLLKPGGRLITYDGCYVTPQSILEKIFLDLDRGRYVRNEHDYRKLINSGFSNITTDIRHDLLKIPYAIIIMECMK